MRQTPKAEPFIPRDLAQMPRAELSRRFSNARASLEIEGFTFEAADTAFFEQMVADRLSEDQMIERIRQRHGLAPVPVAAE